MITIWVRKLQDLKEILDSNPGKSFRLAYHKDDSREIVTLLDEERNTVYFFSKTSDPNSALQEVIKWREQYPNLEVRMGSVILTPSIVAVLMGNFPFFDGIVFT